MRIRAALATLLVSLAVVVACSDDDDGESSTPDGSASGSGGVGGSAATGGTAGSGSGGISTGGASSGGTSGAGTGGAQGGGAGMGGGTGATGGTGGGSSADGGQPIGALCANDTNCSQAQGKTVCCATEQCTGPCECQLEANCPSGSAFLPCNTGADCKKYGGGKICCEVDTGGSTMRFCTKQNGCTGKVIP